MVGDVVVSDWLVIPAEVTTTGVSEAEAASDTPCDVEEDVTSTTLVAISEVVSEDVWPTVVNLSVDKDVVVSLAKVVDSEEAPAEDVAAPVVCTDARALEASAVVTAGIVVTDALPVPATLV